MITLSKNSSLEKQSRHVCKVFDGCVVIKPFSHVILLKN
ncbi:hypothetical protein STRCR_1426 [Streptococcus criceti HS-6]|uniref:Uncharacterized protein n=1 Tax=Streptococcus criceti HS-6 TaxID=873449 RepID=G5JNH1_STRCG|nr:hypothetical protein STRCR_1426 [Streptococcus criceti HS-6]